MPLTYFAKDGNYGQAVGMSFVDTSEWSDSEWKLIKATPDDLKGQIAKYLEEANNAD